MGNIIHHKIQQISRNKRICADSLKTFLKLAGPLFTQMYEALSISIEINGYLPKGSRSSFDVKVMHDFALSSLLGCGYVSKASYFSITFLLLKTFEVSCYMIIFKQRFTEQYNKSPLCAAY